MWVASFIGFVTKDLVALDVHASHVSATLVVSVRALATFLLVSL